MKRWKMILVNVTDPELKSPTPREEEVWAKTARAAVVDFIDSAGPLLFMPGRYRVSVWQVDADGAPVRAAKTSIYTVKWSPLVEESELDSKPDAGAEPQPDLEKDLPPEPDAAAPGPEAGEG